MAHTLPKDGDILFEKHVSSTHDYEHTHAMCKNCAFKNHYFDVTIFRKLLPNNRIIKIYHTIIPTYPTSSSIEYRSLLIDMYGNYIIFNHTLNQQLLALGQSRDIFCVIAEAYVRKYGELLSPHRPSGILPQNTISLKKNILDEIQIIYITTLVDSKVINVPDLSNLNIYINLFYEYILFGTVNESYENQLTVNKTITFEKSKHFKSYPKDKSFIPYMYYERIRDYLFKNM